MGSSLNSCGTQKYSEMKHISEGGKQFFLCVHVSMCAFLCVYVRKCTHVCECIQSPKGNSFCVCVCFCMCLHVCTCVHVYRAQRTTSGIILRQFKHCFLRQGPHFAKRSSLATQQPLASTCLCLPCVVVTSATIYFFLLSCTVQRWDSGPHACKKAF